MQSNIHEACGVFGFYNNDTYHGADLAYYSLFALQHRGQESCGIVAIDKDKLNYHIDMGRIADVFTTDIISKLKGKITIGHVRYSTTGDSTFKNVQPLIIDHLVMAHNGNIINASIIKAKLLKKGITFNTTTDSEVIIQLLKYYLKRNNLIDSIKKMMKELKGSYSLTIAMDNKLIGIRDPWGIRPLCLGKLNNSYLLVSETCALDVINAHFIRDIDPGEIVIIDNKLKSIKTKTDKAHLCIFEYIYFARPDSYIEQNSVYEMRKRLGKQLAIEHPVAADLVIGVPDSGTTAAIGYAGQANIPYGEGLLKNRYIGRTFIDPKQSQRDIGVKIKLNVLKNNVKGKRIIMVDDSIVRGTTMKRIVKLIRDGGAKEVHVRVSSPCFKWPCYFGTDIPSKEQLIANNYNIAAIAKILDVDSIGYLSIEGLKKASLNPNCNFCMGCFTGKYPIKLK